MIKKQVTAYVIIPLLKVVSL